jgi:hypothetical protein
MCDPLLFSRHRLRNQGDGPAEKGEKMTAQQKKRRCPCFKRTMLGALSALLLLPIPARADSINLQQTAELVNSGVAVVRKYGRRSADFSMNGDGDVVMHCLNMSLTVAHNTFDGSPDLREVIQDVHVQLTPNHDGINVKIGFAF